MSENVVVNALAELAKELACPTDEFIFIIVLNQHILAYINIELIGKGTLEGELSIF